jgi:hypothetical protein
LARGSSWQAVTAAAIRRAVPAVPTLLELAAR